MTALRELIEAVEAGRKPVYNAEVFGAERHGLWAHVSFAFNGSLDAARALHDAVLPGWEAGVATCGHNEDDPRPCAVVFDATGGRPVHEHDTFAANADNPARAWLLAILKALGAQS